ncbi:hypothetical protein PAXRUDRAFT_831996 [Paxillus rubicundulus Ve08.2h10]|uniref:Secreted protein n=1 Tax=Paxillus rubicundulus Ve08.2h10 TaxID=930991 RepID=A0A0D0DHG7_9AGAM|nr:hypothetical protein PAXRUDRAFT_831996 [Paxillus rubicundulus Ve08.2h10]
MAHRWPPALNATATLSISIFSLPGVSQQNHGSAIYHVPFHDHDTSRSHSNARVLGCIYVCYCGDDSVPVPEA